jgi:hypothetical protein
MCAFEINFYSQKQEFHRYSTEDFALLDIGIGNYNHSSIGNFFSVNPESGAELKPLNPDIKEFFSNTLSSTLVNNFLGINAIGDMEIMAYDENEKKYKLKRGLSEITNINTSKYKEHTQPNSDNIKLFLKDWHEIQLGIQTDPKKINGYKLIAHRIQNSMSGCIIFPLKDVKILNQPRNSLIRLYILDNKDSDSSKTVSFNGSPFISAIPQTAEGMRYGHENTAIAPVGVYDKTSGDPNNPKDKVAGQMRMVWVPSTRTWESGTQQIMVRLIDDIDAAVIPELTGEELLALSQGQIYDVSPEENPIIAKIDNGRGLVVSTENGNPNLFGPNFRGGCDDSAKKSIIDVVNRSPRAYKQGSLVVCSLINGEWIIVSGEGGLVESKKLFNFGRFEFQQYVLPTNLLFTSPDSASVLSPDIWASKIRDDYYINIGDDRLKVLNLIAKTIPENTDDPIRFILDAFKDKDLRSNLYNNALTNQYIDGTRALTFFNNYYCKNNNILELVMPSTEHTYGVPKNAIAKSARLYNLALPAAAGPSDPIDQLEIPFFWGLVFPDGYQSAGTSKFLARTDLNLRSKTVFDKDPSFKEFSVGVTESLPPIGNDQALFEYITGHSILHVIINELQINPLDLVRQTGGWYRPVSIFRDVINDYSKLYNYLSSEQLDGQQSISNGINKNRITGGVYGLEPINPRKLQFTPLSIDALYSNSVLDYPEQNLNFNFNILKAGIATLGGLLNNTMAEGTATTLLDYNKFLFSQSTISENLIPDQHFFGNKHNFKALAFSQAFANSNGEINLSLLNRHPAPLGVVNGGNIIPPFPKENSSNPRRSPVMPIIAVKSTIKTNSKALRFTVPQTFGNPPKNTVSGGQGGGITILPIGGGIAWSTPASPIQTNSSPQWGDPSREDDIDSFGTDALHVRIFENWPDNQTIFLGPIFTPLHFNPSCTNFKYNYSYDNNTKRIIVDPIRNDDNQQIDNVSTVDFKEPTDINNSIFGVGNSVSTTNLAPIPDWKYNTIRRARLLTGGGFVYLKKVIHVSSVNPKNDEDGNAINRGSNYKNDDEFSFPDGTTFKVNVGTNGDITSIKEIKVNFENNLIIDQSKYLAAITSLNIQPTYLGSGGSGALFDVEFKIGEIIGYDKPPKEVVKKTRLTTSSNNGAKMIETTTEVEVDFSETDKKSFDIFYFFNNDPTSYSIGGVTFNNTLAHYVICEVNPA